MIDKIINMLLKNKDKLKYVGERYTDTGHYYLFRFYLDKKNLFGFKKYLDIISWDDPGYFKDINEPLDIRIQVPSWNIFKCQECIDVDDNPKLSLLLRDIYHSALDNEDEKICRHIEQILDDNIEKKGE